MKVFKEIGDAHASGALSYLAPLGSMLLLAAGSGKLTRNVAIAALIVGGALLGSMPRRRSRSHP